MIRVKEEGIIYVVGYIFVNIICKIYIEAKWMTYLLALRPLGFYQWYERPTIYDKVKWNVVIVVNMLFTSRSQFSYKQTTQYNQRLNEKNIFFKFDVCVLA